VQNLTKVCVDISGANHAHDAPNYQESVCSFDGSIAPNDCEPRVWTTFGELNVSVVADGKATGYDGFDRPSVGEGFSDFVFTDATRTFPYWFSVAEALQEELRPGVRERGEFLDVLFAVVIGETVEEAAVDNVVELCIEFGEFQYIVLLEGCFDITFDCLFLSLFDGASKDIDAGDLATAFGEEKGVLTSAATDVENCARDLVGGINECWLRSADVPRWLPFVHMLEVGCR
jgi:hypothetical protein